MRIAFFNKIEEEDKIRCERLFDIVCENTKDIEIIALAKSINDLKKSLESGQIDDVQEALDEHPIVFLNDHGKGHIQRVLERADDLIKLMGEEGLSPYECYILYCAILVHDVGILDGRAGHTNRVKRFLYASCKEVLKDGFEREFISKIASAHGGSINGDKDTISALPVTTPLNCKEIRARLLAAILRFADELADDSSRQKLDPKFLEKVPQESLIYHYYSKCLHSVLLKTDDYINYVVLTYALTIEDALKKFDAVGGERFLLDEIFARTLKMEVERRYCNKFFVPKLFIDRIEVQINIFDEVNYDVDLPCIEYILEEKGYPTKLESVNTVWTGESLKKHLESKYKEIT